jgi:diguanylate cyclase (GGDEF)-like protein
MKHYVDTLVMRAAPVALGLLLGILVFPIFICRTANAERGLSTLPDNPRYIFQSIGDTEGLGTRAVTSMIQDAKGFAWIGTQDGLYRYDGAEVLRFGKEVGLADTWVTQVEESPDGTIWVVAGTRVAGFDGLKFSSVEIQFDMKLPPIETDRTGSLSISSSNIVYVATKQGLFAFNPGIKKSFRSWTTKNGLPDNNIQAVYSETPTRIWLATADQVFTLNPENNEIVHYDVEQRQTSDSVSAILTDGKGVTWLRTQNHLYRCDPQSKEFLTDDEDLAETSYLARPSLDNSGNILVPSTVGLFYKEAGLWKKVSVSNGLRIGGVSAAMEDREGSLWIGLTGAGVQRWVGRRNWAAWTAAEGLPDNTVWGSMRDSQGRLWVGTNNGVGIWLPKERRWKIVQYSDGLGAYRVWKLAPGPDGYIWSLSRRTGIRRFNPTTLVPEETGIPENFKGNPLDMAFTPDNVLWIGTGKKLYTVRFAEDQLVFEEVELPPELAGSHDVISSTADGSIWIGGAKGVGRYVDGRWRHFPLEHKTKTTRVMNVVGFSANKAWFSTSEADGIYKLTIENNEKRLHNFNMQSGLASDRVWLLDKDRSGQIWTGGPDGVSVVKKDNSIQIFDQGDGLIWNDISQGAFWAEKDGSVLIGTGRGLAYYKPSVEKPLQLPPNVLITSAVLGGLEMVFKKESTVDYEQNSFVAKFAGLTFHNPLRVRYRYQLIGWDHEAIETSQRQVRYAALPAGQYTLEIQCRSAAGIWSKNTARFSFVVLPPWWESWWGRLGGLFLVGLLMILFIEFRTRRLGRERRQLEIAVKERSAQLAQANEELKELSFTDALTKIRNRRFFSNVISADVASTMRKYDHRSVDETERNRDLLFFIIDLDHFKKVNDIFGHAAGDTVLVETAKRLAASLRESDLLVRWGGEEFLILCRDSDRAEGRAIAKRILTNVGNKPFTVTDNKQIHRTCSVGWSAMPGYIGDPHVLTHEVVLELADKALYVAKRSGRNQAVGIELIETAHQRGEQIAWLEEPFEKLAGDVIELIHDDGPDVSTKID